MHARRIVHRDIKGMNIFLHRNGPNMDVKLGDFGISRVLEPSMDLMQTIVGTPMYLAPELVRKSLYTQKCDVWALGVLLYTLLGGLPPFKGNNQLELGDNIVNATPLMKTFWSLKARMVVTALLVKDYSSRIDIFTLDRLLQD